MRIEVRLFAALRERAGKGEIVLVDLPEGLDLAGLKSELAQRFPGIGSLAHVRGAVGNEYVGDARALEDGDLVALIPPVSGGSPCADDAAALFRGVFELVGAPIDAGACQERVRDRTCGAVVLFTGTTRATSRGRDVVRLEYEAFAEMTGPEMARIFERCRAAVATSPERELRMLAVHRVGTVEVGEPSVAIAVASPHRDAAYAASRFLIDELKKSLPVWKKEVYADGHEWVGDRS